MKIAAIAFAAAATIVFSVPSLNDDAREIDFAPLPAYSLTVNENTVIIRNGSASVVVTKAEIRRYLNAKDAMRDRDPVPREQFDDLLHHCEQPIAAMFFAERRVEVVRKAGS